MATETTVRDYEELAEIHHRRRETRQRDQFLVLAADAALSLGQRDRAERLRQRLLGLNPHHLLRPFGSLAEALQSPDIQRFVEDLRRQYPPSSSPQTKQDAPPAGAAGEPLKVVWHTDMTAAAKAPVGTKPPAAPMPSSPVAPAPSKQPAPVPPSPPSRPAPLPRSQPPNGSRRVESPYGQAHALAPVPARADAEDAAEGGWIAVAVFVVCLLGFLALAGYTLVRPVLEGR